MLARILIVIVLAFFIVVIVIPLALGAIGFDIFGRGGRSGEEILAFRSQDKGENWDTPVFIRNGSKGTPREIFDIAFHPSDQKVIFAGTKSAGLWKSDDEGATWRQISDASGTLDGTSDVFRVTISRDHPEIVYVAVYQGKRGRVLKSEDGANTFRQIYLVGRDGLGVFDLYTPPGKAQEILAATGEGRIVLSSDGGKQWRTLKTFKNSVELLSMHGVYVNEGYALSARGEIFRTADTGRNWAEGGVPRRGRAGEIAEIRHPFTQASLFPWGSDSIRKLPVSLSIDPHDPAILYRTSANILFTSSDAGISWQEIRSFIAGGGVWLGGVAVDPVDANTLFVTAGQELYMSADRGINWRITPFASRRPLQKIFINPWRKEAMFISTAR